jgi:hypothetical protein
MGLEAAGERRTQVVTRIVDGGSYMRRYLVGGINYSSQLPSQHALTEIVDLVTQIGRWWG